MIEAIVWGVFGAVCLVMGVYGVLTFLVMVFGAGWKSKEISDE